MTETLYLIGSGPFQEDDLKQVIEQEKDKPIRFVGVDLGCRRFLKLNYSMALAIGDFDSVTANDLEEIKKNAEVIKILPREKDRTDTEEALLECQKRWPNVKKIHLFGMLDGRLDHTLHNLWLAYNPDFSEILPKLYFHSLNNQLRFLFPGNHTIERQKDMRYLSFIALTPVKNLSLSRVKYPLTRYTMPFPQSFISNEFLSEDMQITFQSGKLMCLQTRDEKKD